MRRRCVVSCVVLRCDVHDASLSTAAPAPGGLRRGRDGGAARAVCIGGRTRRKMRRRCVEARRCDTTNFYVTTNFGAFPHGRRCTRTLDTAAPPRAAHRVSFPIDLLYDDSNSITRLRAHIACAVLRPARRARSPRVLAAFVRLRALCAPPAPQPHACRLPGVPDERRHRSFSLTTYKSASWSSSSGWNDRDFRPFPLRPP